MDEEKTIIVNGALHLLSSSIKKCSRDHIINELRVFSSEEILVAHKSLLKSLPATKSTRHARRVKNPDPVILLLDSFQLISEDDLPIFLRCDSNNKLNSISVNIAKNKTDNVYHTEVKDSTDKKTDYEELRDEQHIMKTHLSNIFKAVEELKHQMKLLDNSTSFLTCEPVLNVVSPNKEYLNISKSSKTEISLAHLQQLIDEEADSCERNDKDEELFKEDSDDALDDFEGYSDSCNQEIFKEILVDSSNHLTVQKGYDEVRSKESSIEIISETDKDDNIHSRSFTNDAREIILNARGNGEKNSDPKITVVNNFNLITEPFSCSLCGALFQTEDKLIKHVSTHRNGAPLVCTFCQYTCITAKMMKKHLNFDHSEKLGTQRKNRLFKCVHCGAEYNSKETMQVHVQNHYEEKNGSYFECQMCFDQFPSRQQLARHKKEEHESSCPFHCNICGARFTLKLYLHNHMRTHINVKPHACSYCHQRFINRSKLKLHERTHTGEKPFKCLHCDYRSSRQDNMKYHINSRHINRATTKCPRCDTKFPTEEIQNHLALHSTMLPYQCLDCNRLFKSLGGLRVHYKSSQVHNKKA